LKKPCRSNIKIDRINAGHHTKGEFYIIARLTVWQLSEPSEKMPD